MSPVTLTADVARSYALVPGVPLVDHAAGTSPTATTPAPPHPPLALRYRLAGCRSRGLVAYRHGPARRAVAIGFDDGPATDTGSFVRMLERSRARATFFMIGRQVDAAYRPTLLRELADGDVLGDHTFTHPNLTASPGVRGQHGSPGTHPGSRYR